jgi:CubicO group peptidase (beta-lactamase class C family)
VTGLAEEIDPNSALSPLLGMLPALARKHQVPGAQLAIYHDGEIVTGEVGELEFRTGPRVTRDTAFPVGSITKCFTATVAMILAADGDVAANAPIGDYVSGLGHLGGVISLRQLLSHTSGLADICGTEDLSTPTLRRYVVDQARQENLVLRPGTGFSYSNPGYALAGLLIENVTGMPWAEAVESILLRPLGIEPAFVNLPGARPAAHPIATGHSVNVSVGRTRPVRQHEAPAIAPAGALAVSAADLVKLGMMHVGNGVPSLLPAADAALMRQPVPGADPFGLADGWGMGLAVFRHETADWAGHDGNADGTSCYLRIGPADGWVIALTSNSNTGAGLWRDLLGELAPAGIPGAPGAPAEPGGKLPRSERIMVPVGCVGRYANGQAEYVVTAGANGSIRLSVDGENFVPLTFHEELTFSVHDPSCGRQVFGGRFVRDPNLGILGIQVGGRLARRQHFHRAAPQASSSSQRLASAG